MKAKIIIGLLVVVILGLFGTALFFMSNTPNWDTINYLEGKDPSTKAEDIIPSPTPVFKKIGVRKYNRAPDVLPEKDRANKKAVIETAKGTIEIELFGDEAPKTVSNFIYLAKDGYFDSLIFHRVVPGFVIQGGDPLGNGTGGPGYNFEDEPVKRDYTKGIVAMANAGPNTNGSQFFITLDHVQLQPNYTIFGQVIKGQDVVDNIKVGDVMTKVTIEDYTPVPTP